MNIKVLVFYFIKTLENSIINILVLVFFPENSRKFKNIYINDNFSFCLLTRKLQKIQKYKNILVLVFLKVSVMTFESVVLVFTSLYPIAINIIKLLFIPPFINISRILLV